MNQLLLVAVERCDPSIVRILLAKGASPDYGVGGAAETPLLNAARVGCPEVAMQLLKAGATAAGRAGSAGYDADLPLYTAIQYGHSRVAYLLFPPRTDPNARSRRGTGGELGGVNAGPTLLMEAARQGAVVLAEALLDNGADALLRDGKGQQAIDYLGEHQRQVGQLAARLKPLPPK